MKVYYLCVILLAAPSVCFGYNYSAGDSTTTASLHSPIIRNMPELPAGFAPRDPIVIPVVSDSLEQQRNRAHYLREEVEKAQRFVEWLDEKTVVDLPLGIVKSGGAVDYAIIIDRINFTAQGAILDTFVSFTITQTGDRIAFGGKIPLSRDGGIVGTPRIYLIGDHFINLSPQTLMTLKGGFNHQTFIEIDCNGFVGMSVDAQVEFSKDVIVPEDESGNAVDERVKFNFVTYLQDWNELLVNIRISPFQITGVKGLGFSIQEAALDWSDLANPIGIAFPKGYESALQSSEQPELWRGIFIKRCEVRLPSKLKDGQKSDRTKFGVDNLIIDDTGFSGQLFAENLIKAGDMSGWSYSVDRFRAGIVSGQLQEFSFSGVIAVPLLEKDDQPARMGYLASQDAKGDYLFAVTILSEAKLPLWAADVSLYPASGITVREVNDEFYPSAVLNGMLSIRTNSKGPKSELKGIRFEQLILESSAPYLKGGVFGLGSGEEGSKASKFPLVISAIGVKNNQSEKMLGLAFDVTVNIGKDGNSGFGGTAGLIVWGKYEPPQSTAESTSEQSRFRFEKVEITAIKVDIRKPDVYRLIGEVRFFEDDPTYGDGFKGMFDGTFIKVAVKATAMFGRTSTFRYWYADALVTIESGIALAPGLSAYSLGGGFYSGMKQSGTGSTPSGVNYVPDEHTVGLMAFVNYGSSPKGAYDGDLNLEVAMNRHGGINFIQLKGSTYFLVKPLEIGTELVKQGALKAASKAEVALDKLSPRGQLSGNIDLHFDNVNDVFHGNVEVYVNVVGGIVKGIGAGNKAGWAVLHFEKNDWYVLIGTPEQPIGLEVARIFQARSYFMMGMNLPGSPPPPENVSRILGNVDLDYMRDVNSLQSGLGFAFGMHFGVDTGDLRFLMFYGRFAAGTGFDIMLKNYGTGYHCEGTNDPFGVNGWYANGQAYAFVEGRIGIRVNLKFYKGDYDILAIGAAAVLQAKGPNPFWMKGTVGGYYRILGGLVKGTCRFEVTVGKECKPVAESNPLQDVAIIADVSPARGSNDIDVFVSPQAAFNIPIGEVFEITDAENKRRYFRARLEEFSARDQAMVLAAKQEWNAASDVAVLNTHEILPPKKEIKVKVKVVFEERTNGIWQAVMFQGRRVEETAETNFKTGEAPDYIPESNVALSYPLIRQYNFYPGEFEEGFIRLRKGQAYLFELNRGWEMVGTITSAQQSDPGSEFRFSYDAGNKEVNFNISKGLTNSLIYELKLLSRPQVRIGIDENVRKVRTQLVEDAEGAAELTTKELEGTVSVDEDKSLYRQEFRASRYSTFNEKMTDMRQANTRFWPVAPGLVQLTRNITGAEYFDKAEIEGFADQPPMIQLEVSFNNRWYREEAGPKVYNNYPIEEGLRLRDRSEGEWGIPPSRSATISQESYPQALDDNGVNSRIPFALTSYRLWEVTRRDLWDLQLSAANKYMQNPSGISDEAGALLVADLNGLNRDEDYEVRLVYKVPGANRNGSSFTLRFRRQ